MGMTLRGTGPHGGQPVVQAGAALQRRGRSWCSCMAAETARGDPPARRRTSQCPGWPTLRRRRAGTPVSEPVPRAHSVERAVALVGARRPRRRAVAGRTGRGACDAHRAARVLARGLPRAGVRRAQPAALRCTRWTERGARRFAGHGLAAGGSLDDTPVFLGCSDVDPHIPAWRVEESADVLREMGGDVNAVLYPGMDHTVRDEEVREVRRMIAPLGQRGGLA